MFNLERFPKAMPFVYVCSFLSVFFVYQYARIWLSAFGFFEHGYWFADEQYQLLFNCIICILPFTLLVLAAIRVNRKSLAKTLMIWLPVTLILEFILGFILLLYGGVARQSVEELPLKGGVVAKIRYGLDADSNYYGTSVWPSMLLLERKVIGGLFLEYKMLIFVNPTGGAHIRLIDGGNKISFTDESYKGPRVIRQFDSDWNSKTNRSCERISR